MKPERELSEEEKIEGKEKLGRKGKLFLPLGGYFPAAAREAGRFHCWGGGTFGKHILFLLPVRRLFRYGLCSLPSSFCF